MHIERAYHGQGGRICHFIQSGPGSFSNEMTFGHKDEDIEGK